MRRLELCLSISFISGVLAFSACSSSTSNPTTGKGGTDGGAGHGGSGGGAGTSTDGGAGTGGSNAGAGGGDAAVDMTTSETGDGPIDASLTPEQTRGQYLVTSVLGCGGCHTPKAVDGGTPALLSGVDCFVNTTSEAGTNCLSSANLTNDPAGIKNLSDQQVINAFTKGVFPSAADAGTQYLFANMPYYQFSNLTMTDAMDIVAYLRSLPASSHVPAPDTGTFATRLTAAQWTPVAIADLPNPPAADGGTDAGSDAGTDAGADAGTVDAGATGNATNGKYLATLACSVCHTVNTAATSPLMLDATKAFQGGKEFTTTVNVPVDAGADGGSDAGDGGTDAAATMPVSKKIQSANLTPDTTGLLTWTPAQIATAIKKGTDEGGRTICSPMRPFPTMADQDALDIATYLKAIPAATNALTETCE